MKSALDVLRKLLRDPAAAAGLLIILLLVLTAILAPLIATHPEAVWDMNPRERLLPPSHTYLFGTDRMGADIYSRVLFGARIALTITYWPWFTRLVHAEVRSLKNETFIEAAIALGVPTWRIILGHVLPNV